MLVSSASKSMDCHPPMPCRNFLQSHFPMRCVLIENALLINGLPVFLPMGTNFAWVPWGCVALCRVAPKRTNATLGKRKMQAIKLKQIVLAVVAVAGLTLAGGSRAGYIDAVTNLEWRQLTETLNISFNALNTGGVNGCSAATGACSGLIGAVDLTGWTWATEPEVRILFHNFSGAQFIPGFTPLPGAPTLYSELFSTWAPAIIDIDGVGVDTGIFERTEVSFFGSFIIGMTRTLASNGFDAVVARIRDGSDDAVISDVAQTSFAQSPILALPSRGVWMYRQGSTSDVPVPPTPWLLAIGIAALWSVRRLTARGA
jgi:hypothetical protein